LPRVIGIDPGTVSVDLCGLDEGQVFLDRSIPTAEALAAPTRIPELLEQSAPLDLVVGPSGYGLPLTAARDLTDADLRLAFLAADGETGGIGGLRALMRQLARVTMPVMLTPGVVHLATVPAHRKVNRVDMGTADKVCAVALAIREMAERRACPVRDVSFILLELGGAFSAAIAVDGGRIVDGMGGSSGPLGMRAAGALDGEVAFLAGSITKSAIFAGGAEAIAGAPGAGADWMAASQDPRARVAWDAYVESAAKAVAALSVAVPQAHDVVLSGRGARSPRVRDALAHRLLGVVDGVSVSVLQGFADVSSLAAQGAALVADGLCGGPSKALVETMDIRGASGTVLDHLFAIDSAAARARLGITESRDH
jgi:predicted butyrate kinase (DUF1464 family)